MKNIFNLFLFTGLIVLAPHVRAAFTEPDRAEIVFKNLLKENNPGFENATGKWTSSGGTLAVVSSGTNFMGIGNANATWDSSASGQTLTSSSITIPNGYAGTNGLWRCKVMNLSGATTTMGTWDGTTFSNAIAINPGTTPKYVEIAAPFGSSATTTAIRFTSVASNEPLISIDDCYIGQNFNLSSVNPITDWVVYTPTFVGVGTVTSINMEWRRVGANLEIRGNFTNGTPTGTTATMTLPTGLSIGGGVTTIHACGRGEQDSTATGSNKGFIALCTQGQNTINFSIDGTGVAFSPIVAQTGSTVFLTSSKSSWQQFSVPILGWAANSAVRADTTPQSWSGIHDSDCLWSTTTTGSYVDFAGDSTCTFTQKTNTNFGTVASATSAGNNIPGIVWTPSKLGTYFVCANVSFAASANSGRVQLTDGTIVLAQGTTTVTGSNAQLLCSPYIVSSLTSTTLKIQGGLSGAGTEQIGGNTAAPTVHSIEWSIVATGQGLPAPLLIGSVTSNTSGVERIERAAIAGSTIGSSCSSTPCTIYNQSSSWISSVTRSATGVYSITANAGTWSSSPVCTISLIGSGCGQIRLGTMSNIMSTGTEIDSYSTTGSAADCLFNIICMGPR